jgi:hypothetical protein
MKHSNRCLPAVLLLALLWLPSNALDGQQAPDLSDAQKGVPLPANRVDARAYGAKCIGTGFDDTDAIQAALGVAYAYSINLLKTVSGVVELPAGTCHITKPLKMGLHGSLIGQGEATIVLVNYTAWKAGPDHNALEVAITGPIPSGEAVAQRRIGNFILMGIGNSGMPDSVGIHLYNTVGKYDQTHQIPYFNIGDMMITGFDTGIEGEDWLSSSINNVNLTCVRQGIWLNGHAVNIQIGHTQMAYSSFANQHTSNHSATVGLLLSPNAKYCNNCTNYPQGISFHDSSIVAFDDNVWIQHAVTVSIHDSVLDYGALGIVNKGAGIRISSVGGGLFIHHNYLSMNPSASAYGIYSEANATDGVWIESNYLTSYDISGKNSQIGILLAGGGPTRDWHINSNTFLNYSVGVQFKQAAAYSEVKGNFGERVAGALIDLAGQPGLVYQSMSVKENMDPAGPAVRSADAKGVALDGNSGVR